MEQPDNILRDIYKLQSKKVGNMFNEKLDSDQFSKKKYGKRDKNTIINNRKSFKAVFCIS